MAENKDYLNWLLPAYVVADTHVRHGVFQIVGVVLLSVMVNTVRAYWNTLGLSLWLPDGSEGTLKELSESITEEYIITDRIKKMTIENRDVYLETSLYKLHYRSVPSLQDAVKILRRHVTSIGYPMEHGIIFVIPKRKEGQS